VLTEWSWCFISQEYRVNVGLKHPCRDGAEQSNSSFCDAFPWSSLAWKKCSGFSPLPETLDGLVANKKPQDGERRRVIFTATIKTKMTI